MTINMYLKKNALVVLLQFLFTIALITKASAQATETGNHDLESWIEDVEYLKKELPERHTDLYHHTPKAVFDSAFTSLLNKLPNLNNYERLVEVSKIMHLLGPGNGHSRVRYSGGILKNQLPFRGYSFSDRFYIVSTSPENKDLLGAEIVTLEGMAIDSVLSKIGTFVPADNDWNRLLRASLFISLPEILYGSGISKNKDAVNMEVEKDGEVSAIEVQAIPLDEDFLWIDSWEDYHFKYSTNENWNFLYPDENSAPLHLQEHENWFKTALLGDQKTLYARMNRTRDYEGGKISDFFATIFEHIDSGKAEKLILDLRYNVGGNLMTTPPFIHGIIKRDSINQPDKFIVLTGRATYSAAQYLATRLDEETNATFVGEPTGGKPNLFGDAPRFELPKTKIRLSASVLYFQVTWPWIDDMATFPQLYVPYSFNNFINNEDPVLEKAMSYDFSPLSEKLSRMYEQNGIDELLNSIKKYKDDEQFQFYETDGIVYQFGADLMGDDKFLDAAAIFNYLKAYHPENINLLEQLAEAYISGGDIDRAKNTYQAILKIEPDHEQASNFMKEH